MKDYYYAYAGLSALKRYGLKILQNLVIEKEELLYIGKDRRLFACDLSSKYSKFRYPENSFIEKDGEYLCCPELAFIHAARGLSAVQAIFLATELINPTENISNKKKLTKYLMSVKGLAGKIKAEYALKYAIENSFSQPESQLALNLCLPARLGGHGLPLCKMNAVVELPEEIQRECGHEFFQIDLSWLDKLVGIEYDSIKHHGDPGEEKWIKDAERKRILTNLSWEIFSKSSSIFRSRDDVADLAAEIAERIRYYRYKKRLRPILYFDARNAYQHYKQLSKKAI